MPKLLPWEPLCQYLARAERQQCLRPSQRVWKSPFCPCPYPCPGEFQPLFLCQYLGGSLLKLPEEQEGLSPLLVAQTLGWLVQGERNQDLRARESLVVVDALRSPQARVSKDPSNIKGFTPRDIAVIPSHSGELLCESVLSLLHPKSVRILLLGLGRLFKQLGSLPGLAKFFAKLCHQLFLCCHVYFSVVQLLSHIFKLLFHCP